MKTVQVLSQFEVFQERLLDLNKPHSNISDFENKLTENELFDFLANVEELNSTDAFESSLLSSIVDLVNDESFRQVIKFKRLDLSDLSVDESHPDNGNVEETIDQKSEYLYDKLRQEAAPIIDELNNLLNQLLLIPE